MGDIADAMLGGELCEMCGVYLGEGDGFPRYCSRQCARDRGADYVPIEGHSGKQHRAGGIVLKALTVVQRQALNEARMAEKKKIPCPICQRKVKTIGLADHVRDSHPEVK